MNSAGGVNSGWEVNSGRQEQFLKRDKFWLCSILLHFLLFFPSWSLICNAEFDSNSSCLD